MCSDPSTCGTCSYGYGPDGNGGCTSCAGTCAQCPLNPSTCTFCKIRYHLNSGGNCQPCSDSQCLLCMSSIGSCNSC